MRRILTSLTVLVLAACDEGRAVAPRTDGGGASDGGGVATVVGAVARYQPVDVLFVVDNSASMADEQEALARSFGAFLEVAARHPLNDYRIAVISTDAGGDPGDTPSGLEDQGLVDNRFGPPPYYTAAGQMRADCSEVANTAHACFRGPAPKVIASTLSTEAQLAQFGQTARLGSCGTGNEQPLLALELALTKNCNTGFLRAGARLVVVIVTDEDDSSPAGDYVQAIVDATGKPVSDVRVAALVGAVGHEAAWCGASGASCGEATCALARPEDAPSRLYWDVERDACRWCTYFNAPDCCSAKPSTGLVAFARALEDAVRAAHPFVADTDCASAPGRAVACVVASICDADFSDSFRRIARDLVVNARFDLTTTTSTPADVRVSVAGQTLVSCASVAAGAACDFTVSSDGRTVTIVNPDRVPAPTDAVVVSSR